MLQIYITRGNGQGVWLELPSSPEETREACAVLEVVNSENLDTQIGEAASSVPGLPDYLCGIAVTGKTLKELDFLARRIENMTEPEQDIFGAALVITTPGSLMELINLSCNMDKFDHYPGITGEASLGKYLVNRDSDKIPERLSALIDYESVGVKYVQSHAGCFTEGGYTVRSGQALEPLYDGEHLPDPCYEKNSLLILKFNTKGYSPTLYLPAPEAKLLMMAKNLRVSSLDEITGFSIKENVEGLKDRLPCRASVRDLNRFMSELAQGWDGTEEQRKKLFAALEAEAPTTIDEAVRIYRQLDQYEIVLTTEEYTTPSDYAHKVMEDSEQYYVDGFTSDFVDYEELGKAMIKEDGAIQTSFGIVLRSDHAMSQLPGELISLRLFSPLSAQLDERDYCGVQSGRSYNLYSCELCNFEVEIREAVEKENQYLDGERGLAKYIGNKILNRKVFSMKPSIEAWEDEVWGVLEVQVHGELSEGEMKELISEWLGQESNGWGKRFEQREIEIPEGALYVSFWQPGGEFFIKSEDELKNQQEHDIGIQRGGM